MEKQNGTGLARVEAAPMGLSGSVKIDSMADVFRLAGHLAKARGFVPDIYADKPEALAAVILTGIELGLGPMQAMREVYDVKGKPSLSATLMIALAQKAGVRVRWVKTDATIATIAVTVPGEAEQTMSFTKEDAERAGLWGQGTWKAYPANMLRARCASTALRAFCPAVFGGGSVYESESGEATGGVPAAEVLSVQAEVVPEAPKRNGKMVTECSSADELREWCGGHREVVAGAGAKGYAKVTKHAATLSVSEHVVRQWLGMAPVELEDGSLATDPP